jgi:DNA-binding MarR family transcriptional regulator
MSPVANPLAPEPAERLARAAQELIVRASATSRLLVKHMGIDISRTDAVVLATLSDAPRRITELAEASGLAQPTITLLAKRLEQRGWVTRERQTDDGRVVLISLTKAGGEALKEFRARYRAVLRDHLGAVSARQLAALEEAVEILDELQQSLKQGVLA